MSELREEDYDSFFDDEEVSEEGPVETEFSDDDFFDAIEEDTMSPLLKGEQYQDYTLEDWKVYLSVVNNKQVGDLDNEALQKVIAVREFIKAERQGRKVVEVSFKVACPVSEFGPDFNPGELAEVKMEEVELEGMIVERPKTDKLTIGIDPARIGANQTVVLNKDKSGKLKSQTIESLKNVMEKSKLGPQKTVRQQVEVEGGERRIEADLKARQENLTFLEQIKEAGTTNKVQQKWLLAMRVSKGDSEAQLQVEIQDFEFGEMVKHCRKHPYLKAFPSSMDDLYFPRLHCTNGPEATARYYAMSERILKVLFKARTTHISSSEYMNRMGYRARIAAYDLERALYTYAEFQADSVFSGDSNTGPEFLSEEMLIEDVKNAALAYYHSRLRLNVKSVYGGDKEPDYATYLQICQKYGIKIGSQLHEQM